MPDVYIQLFEAVVHNVDFGGVTEGIKGIEVGRPSTLAGSEAGH